MVYTHSTCVASLSNNITLAQTLSAYYVTAAAN